MSVASEQPEYLRRIDEALKYRGQMVAAIEAFFADAKSNQLSASLKELLVTLRSDSTAAQIVRDQSKAVWLPLLLRAVDGSEGVNFQKILGDITIVNEVRRSGWIRHFYPILVGAVAFVLMLFLSIAILPTFQTMFREFELKLPASTRMVLRIGSVVRDQPFVFLGCLILGIAATKFVTKAIRFAKSHLEGSFSIGPMLAGNSESVRAMGRFASTLAELLNIGAPLREAIEIAGRSSRNLRLTKMSFLLAREMEVNGESAHATSVAKQFPSLLFQALEAGPNRTPSISLLRQIAVSYFERVEARFQFSAGLISPLAMLVIGGCVWFVVISLLMPLFSLITALSGPG